VPGNRPHRFAKACAAGADAGIVDGKMIDRPIMRKAGRVRRDAEAVTPE
jgi:citrate lyase beta subunit